MRVVAGFPGEEGGHDRLRRTVSETWLKMSMRVVAYRVEEVAQGVVHVPVIEECLVAELPCTV